MNNELKNFVTDDIKNCRVLVIGDVMLDRYCFGEVTRISPEAPVPINRVTKIKETLGGAANVAHNLALLGCQTSIIAQIGNDNNGDGVGDINIPIPYKTKGFNLTFGMNIVIGHKSDKDKDGVKDQYDICPGTPKKVSVDSYGCPIDSDGDGVPDYLDQCPGTPNEAYGLGDEAGCPIDSDGDGVPDYIDKCPMTPEAAWGQVDEWGCPLDSDDDGVPDYLDECPNTPQGARGYVDEKGCLLDTDGDGVPDYIDECPDTPAEARGFVDEKEGNINRMVETMTAKSKGEDAAEIPQPTEQE